MQGEDARETAEVERETAEVERVRGEVERGEETDKSTCTRHLPRSSCCR